MGAIRGAFGPGKITPGQIVVGAIIGGVIGYIGYEVAGWDYTAKVQWMPPGFKKTGWLGTSCTHYNHGRSNPWGRWAQSAGFFNILGPGATCAPDQFESGNLMGSGIVNPSTTSIVLTRKHTGSTVVVPWEEWQRPVPGVGTPAPNTAPWTFDVPEGLPWLDPMTVPMDQPVPWAKPAPFRFATPRPGEMPPAEKPAEWPEIIEYPRTTSPVVEVPPFIGGSPGVGPIVVIDPTPDPSEPEPEPDTDSPGAPGYTPPPGARYPPRDGEYHRKLNVKNTVHPGVHVGLNIATEGLDLVRELYKGVPKKCRESAGVKSSRPSVAEKMKAIWHCREQINMAVAFENLVNNEFEDWFYGRLGRLTGKATRKLNVTTGLNRALRFASKQAQAELPEGDTILPELVYDPDRKVWGLKWGDHYVEDPWPRG